MNDVTIRFLPFYEKFRNILDVLDDDTFKGKLSSCSGNYGSLFNYRLGTREQIKNCDTLAYLSPDVTFSSHEMGVDFSIPRTLEDIQEDLFKHYYGRELPITGFSVDDNSPLIQEGYFNTLSREIRLSNPEDGGFRAKSQSFVALR